MSRLFAWLVLLIALLTSAPFAHADDAKDKAVAFVEKFGGIIHRIYRKPGNPVDMVHLYKTKMQDADLKQLALLTDLTFLNLEAAANITDAGLKEVVPLKNITYLNLSNTKVTDAGLKELAPLRI